MTKESPLIKRDYTFTLSLILFIFSVFITLWVYSYNYFTAKSIDDLKIGIEASKNAIDSIKKNDRVQTYLLLENNKSNIEKLDKTSNIITYIEHFKSIESKYLLNFSWFNYSDLKISTNVTAEKGIPLAYVKTADFIEKYRAESDSWAIFKLPFISSVNGKDELTFSVNFEVK